MAKVAKWGNSLALRLPAAVVSALELKEGDDIAVTVTVTVTGTGTRSVQVERDESRLKAIEEIRKLAKPMPEGFRFDRLEAHERG